MESKDKLLSSYMECLNKITGYNDIGNELNFLSDRDELLCKISSITLVGLMVKWEFENKGKYVSDMGIISDLAKIVDLSETNVINMSYALMCSNEGISTCKEICMKDNSMSLEHAYNKLKGNKSFEDIVTNILDNSNVKVECKSVNETIKL